MSFKGTPYYDLAIDAGMVAEEDREAMAKMIYFEEMKRVESYDLAEEEYYQSLLEDETLEEEHDV